MSQGEGRQDPGARPGAMRSFVVGIAVASIVATIAVRLFAVMGRPGILDLVIALVLGCIAGTYASRWANRWFCRTGRL